MVDGGDLGLLAVWAGREELTGTVENCGCLGLRLEASGDHPDGVQDSGVVAVELTSYLGKGERGFLTCEIHRELPGM